MSLFKKAFSYQYTHNMRYSPNPLGAFRGTEQKIRTEEGQLRVDQFEKFIWRKEKFLLGPHKKFAKLVTSLPYLPCQLHIFGDLCIAIDQLLKNEKFEMLYYPASGLAFEPVKYKEVELYWLEIPIWLVQRVQARSILESLDEKRRHAIIGAQAPKDALFRPIWQIYTEMLSAQKAEQYFPAYRKRVVLSETETSVLLASCKKEQDSAARGWDPSLRVRAEDPEDIDPDTEWVRRNGNELFGQVGEVIKNGLCGSRIQDFVGKRFFQQNPS